MSVAIKGLFSAILAFCKGFFNGRRQTDESREDPGSPVSVATYDTATESQHADRQPSDSIRSSARLGVRESLQRRQTQ